MSNGATDPAAASTDEALAERVATSRQLGADPELVLYGGGNTSLKARWQRPGGVSQDCLYVKGSGTDLGAVTERDFTALALEPTRALLDGPPLDNEALMAALEPLKLDPAAARPSIETLLHAALPHASVDHTHADAALALVNTLNGTRLARTVYGELAPLVPFRRSGFALAQACRETFHRAATANTIGLILHQHGAVSFGADACRSRTHMLRLAELAQRYLETRAAWTLPRAAPAPRERHGALALARLRGELSAIAGFALLLAIDCSPEAMGFAQRGDAAELSAGPATAQHAVFTRGQALCGNDVGGWSRAYAARLAAHAPSGWPAARLPDSAPRVVVDRRFGIAAAGVDAAHAAMAAEVFRHGFAIASRAAAHDRYAPIDATESLLAELHYGGFERALIEARREAPLTGAVAVLDLDHAPAAAALQALGAAVVVAGGSQCQPLEAAVVEACWRHGGVDALVSAVPPAQFSRRVLGASPLAGTWFNTAGAGAAAGLDTQPVQGLEPARLARSVAQRLGMAVRAAA